MLPFFRPGDRGGPDPDRLAVLAFQDLWRSEEPSFEQFWAALGPGRSLSLLSALAKVELNARFVRGERPRVTEYLGRFPELAEDGDRVISLIYEEFCLLEEKGEDPDSAEFCEHYAPWGDSLRSQLGYHRELSRVAGSPSPSIKFPMPGDRFATYQLRSILGKGGAAHVYLAIEEDLGGRKVALKISASVGREPSILANLDHPNVVPILTTTEVSETGLRGFVMPYRPGITLEELIRRVGRGRPGRKAELIWKALEAGRPGAARPATENEKRPGWEGFPIRGTYHEAVAWLGAALAEAVAYLHANDVLHRDIKPANILLADREGPQLLDFHLAHAPNAPPHAQAALNGGTLPYMAPEQLGAFLDPGRWGEVGKPADIYALGLVLREMVTGLGPDLPDEGLPLTRAISGLLERREAPAESVREINPSIPPSLAAIVDKCLDPDPSRRHATARALADDLRLFLERRPLASAPNTSPMERFANLLHHQRKTVGVLLIVLLVAIYGYPGRARSAPPFAARADIVAAVADLDSDIPDRWARARDTFERLRQAQPNSAYPPLYLSLAFEKLGDIPTANHLIDEAATHPRDIGEAIDRRLKDDRPSVTLLMAQANQLIVNERYPEAEVVLRKIIAKEPGHLGATVGYGKVELGRKNPAAAIPHFEAAIGRAEKERGDVKAIHSWRSVILPLLNDQGNSELARVEDPAARSRAAKSFGKMAEQLDAMRRAWGEGTELPGTEKREFTLAYFAGLLQSGRGAIEAGAGDCRSARALFQSARDDLNRARRAIPANSPQWQVLRSSVDASLRELDSRARRVPRS